MYTYIYIYIYIIYHIHRSGSSGARGRTGRVWGSFLPQLLLFVSVKLLMFYCEPMRRVPRGPFSWDLSSACSYHFRFSLKHNFVNRRPSFRPSSRPPCARFGCPSRRFAVRRLFIFRHRPSSVVLCRPYSIVVVLRRPSSP